MPTPPNNGTGFVSLGDYLGANQDPLNAQYANDSQSAHDVGDSFNSLLGFVPSEAENMAKQTGAAGDPLNPLGSWNGADPYGRAMGAAQNAQDLSTKFGSQAGMAGAGRNPVSGDGSFNAALEQGAHGGDYASLSGYLKGFTPAAVDDAWNAGSAKGIGEWVDPYAAKPGAPPVEPKDPGQPPGEQGSPTPDQGDPNKRRQGGK